MPLESSMYPKIEDYLKGLPGCSYRKRHGCIYSSRHDSDFIVLWKSVHYEIECKLPGRKATEGQLVRLRKCIEAGGISAIVTSVDQFKAVIVMGQRGWINHIIEFADVVIEQPKRLTAGERKQLAEAELNMKNVNRDKLKNAILG